MLSFAILIDGGFAKRKIGTAKSPATAETFSRMVGATLEFIKAEARARDVPLLCCKDVSTAARHIEQRVA